MKPQTEGRVRGRRGERAQAAETRDAEGRGWLELTKSQGRKQSKGETAMAREANRPEGTEREMRSKINSCPCV
eukprot:1627502-Pleurochrysis_carterae.AAC.1